LIWQWIANVIIRPVDRKISDAYQSVLFFQFSPTFFVLFGLFNPSLLSLRCALYRGKLFLIFLVRNPFEGCSMFYRYRFLSRGAAIVLTLGLVMSPASSAIGASTNGTSNATIIAPLTINVINPFLAFGQVVPSEASGAVVITANGGSTTRTTTGGTSVLPGPFGASVFFVTGETGSPVTVVLPTSILVNAGPNNMTVDTFQSSPPSPYNQPGGGQFLSVGGTLHVAANQPAGNYSGTFDVSVNY
jgi:hypothetical protein